MKFYSIVKDNKLFKDFICETGENYFLIKFSDRQKDNVLKLIREEYFNDYCGGKSDYGLLKSVYTSFVDQEGILYQVNLGDGKSEKKGKYGLNKFRKLFFRLDKSLSLHDRKVDEIKERYKQNTVVFRKSFIPKYKKFDYYDVEQGLKISCRFSKAKSENKRPLLIYLHGAGSFGEDNIKQLAEYLTAGIKVKDDCYILLPQLGGVMRNDIKDIINYVKTLKNLVTSLEAICNIDKDRIYITGISFGGECVWYSLYENPGYYAAAIPLMGNMPHAYSDYFELRNFADANIWSAHATDDKVVSVDDDLYLYERIKKSGGNIRFSKYEHGGHSIMRKFYKNENWQEWLFAQRKKS